ncbi:uncharacterized protein LOC132197454 [Neocloeon triangulifer]|uniref:uncharacterized protein LOC132197454 n=1 Tax=Neocloeon triangulifer TaxID=2078957 RepID=UPI00286F3A7F|nr:uncharacterized protein LOC132197454 [Neocloeon triangulifer]
MAATTLTSVERTMPDELDDFPEEELFRNFLNKDQYQFCVEVIKFSWWQSTFCLKEFMKFDATFLATNCFCKMVDEKKRNESAAMLLQVAKGAAEGKIIGEHLKWMLQRLKEIYDEKKDQTLEDIVDKEEEMNRSEVDELDKEADEGEESDQADEGKKLEEEEETNEGNEATNDDDELEEENTEPADLSFNHDYIVEHGGPPIFLTPAEEPLVDLPEPDKTPREVTRVWENQQYLSNCAWFRREDDKWVFVTSRCVYSSILNAIFELIKLGHRDWAKSVIRENSPMAFHHFISLAVDGEKSNVDCFLQYHSLRLVEFCKEAKGLVVHGEVAPNELMDQLKWKAGEQVQYCNRCKIFSKTALHFVELSQLNQLRVGKQPKASACPRCDGNRTAHLRLNQLGFPVAVPQSQDDPVEIASIFQERIITEKIRIGETRYQVRAAIVTYDEKDNQRHCVALMPPERSRSNNPELWSVLDSNEPDNAQSLDNYAANSGRLNLVFYLR